MTDGAPGPESLPDGRTPTRRWLPWIAAPAVLGIVAGVASAAFPWARDLLGFAMVVSGLAWLLRAASDWFAERVGPQRGVMVLGSILLGTWLALAVSSPGPLRRLGFGPIRLTSPERDPYALPPAGSPSPLHSSQQPSEPIDLKSLVTREPREPEPREPEPASQPTNGRPAATTATLRLSSATSVAGEGIVLIGTVRGDGRPVHGVIEFLVGDEVVSKQPLRVQGETSQAEFRLLGLKPGLYTIRAVYRGNRSFEASQSERVPHRVVAR